MALFHSFFLFFFYFTLYFTLFFHGWVAFLCINIPHLLYSFICPWTFRCFRVFSSLHHRTCDQTEGIKMPLRHRCVLGSVLLIRCCWSLQKGCWSSWREPLGDEDITRHENLHVSKTFHQTGTKPFEEETSAKVCLVGERGELAFPETWEARPSIYIISMAPQISPVKWVGSAPLYRRGNWGVERLSFVLDHTAFEW